MTCSTNQRDDIYSQVATPGPSEQEQEGYLLLGCSVANSSVCLTATLDNTD